MPAGAGVLPGGNALAVPGIPAGKGGGGGTAGGSGACGARGAIPEECLDELTPPGCET
ncbi:MAG: hypothetical protein KF819_24420 [Labilithrix sp.]|nr:hypothetical protein [Labilithrix sp.]